MQTIEINVYKYEELSEEAKKKARDWYESGIEYLWIDDAIDSIKAFCAEFGIHDKIKYQFEPFGYCYITCGGTDGVFRGRKLSEFKPDYMPTGYHLDCDLWETFYRVFKETGDCKRAFNEALDRATTSIRYDMESQYDIENIEDGIICNDFDFREDGTLFTG